MLAYETLAAPEGRPRAAFLFLHGILGRGRNWRSLARRFAEERPEWLAVTVDLRGHGDSLGLAPPHTVASAASDLGGIALDVPVRAVLGHSFGGKVALAFAEQRRSAGRPLLGTWMIDSTPSARPDRRGSEAVSKVLAVLEEMPERFEDRRAFVRAATERGLARPIAQWLAMNLRSADGGYVYGVEMDVVHAMLEDYFGLDQWPTVDAGGVELVLGGESEVFDAEDRARAEALAARNIIGLHVIEGAGHWVHADAPGELSELLRQRVPEAAVGDRSS